MLKLVVALILLAFSVAAEARDVRVRGYYRKDGTYVSPHTRSAPNRTTADNWSTRGNFNPYTGKRGTKPETPAVSTPYYWAYPSTPKPSPPSQSPVTDLSRYDIDDSAHKFLNVCGGNFLGGRDYLGYGICTGYIAGYVDAARDAGLKTNGCVPDDVTAEDALEIFSAYLRRYPQSMLNTGSTGPFIRAVMSVVFPCPATPADKLP